MTYRCPWGGGQMQITFIEQFRANFSWPYKLHKFLIPSWRLKKAFFSPTTKPYVIIFLYNYMKLCVQIILNMTAFSLSSLYTWKIALLLVSIFTS
jgi:hypothetical protein